MLSPTLVEEIRRLLAEGKLSQREISTQLHVSRGTITSVSMNRRRERRPRDEEPETDHGPPQRCPTCGGLVYMPCRLCRTRAAKYGPLGERSLRAIASRAGDVGGPNERRLKERRLDERPSCRSGPSESLRSPREVSSPTPFDRGSRLPGR